MKRIVVFSDTHGNIHPCLRILPGLGEVSLIIHLGDTVADCEKLREFYPHIPFLSVKGNNDWFCSAPELAVAEVEGVRILCCHGHSLSHSQLIYEAQKRNCTYVLLGHTHRSLLKTTEEGITFLNPGSASRPRDARASCGVIEIENGVPSAAILPL